MVFGAIAGALSRIAGGAAVAAGEGMEIAGAVATPMAVAAETAAVAGSAAAVGAEVAAGASAAGGIGASAVEVGAVGVAQAEGVLGLIPPVAETAVVGEMASVSSLPLIDSLLALPEVAEPVAETAAIAEKASTFLGTSPLPPLEIPGVMENPVPTVSPTPIIETPNVNSLASTIDSLPKPEVPTMEGALEAKGDSFNDGSATKTESQTGNSANNSTNVESPNSKPSETSEPAKTEENQEDKSSKTNEPAEKKPEEKPEELPNSDEEKAKKIEKLRMLMMERSSLNVEIAGIKNLKDASIEIQAHLSQLQIRRDQLNIDIGLLQTEIASMAMSSKNPALKGFGVLLKIMSGV